jgi:hypothetical protein
MKIISVFQRHEFFTNKDLYVTYLKKKKVHILGKTAVGIVRRGAGLLRTRRAP